MSAKLMTDKKIFDLFCENGERLNDSIPPEVLIRYLVKERKERESVIKSLKQRIGEQESYIQELEYYIKSHNVNKEVSREYSKEIKKEEMYRIQKDLISKKNKKIKDLTIIRDKLFYELSKHGIVLKLNGK